MSVFLQAKMRNRTAGLGLKGSDYGATAGDSERDLLKKMVRIYFVYRKRSHSQGNYLGLYQTELFI